MQRLSELSEANAIARINEHWATQDLSDPEGIVLHEGEEYWATTIYYGKSFFWWLYENESPLRLP
jgi:hypothetical protein